MYTIYDFNIQHTTMISLTLYSKIILFQDEYINVVAIRPNPKNLLHNPNITLHQKEKIEYLLSISKSFTQPKLSIFDNYNNTQQTQCISTTCDLIVTQKALPFICGYSVSNPLGYNFLPDFLNDLMSRGFSINNDVAKISKYLGFYTTQCNVNNSLNSKLIANLMI